jgi:hypothetical protein
MMIAEAIISRAETTEIARFERVDDRKAITERPGRNILFGNADESALSWTAERRFESETSLI